MQTIEVTEAKRTWLALIEGVARGETYLITEHGRPVALLTPPTETATVDAQAAVNAIRAARVGVRLDGLSVRELLEEGRM